MRGKIQSGQKQFILAQKFSNRKFEVGSNMGRFKGKKAKTNGVRRYEDEPQSFQIR
jgi:hypothetical protein